MPAEDYSELLEFYNLKQTVGSGGFAKVKVGVHLLTNERVAVKIVDKNGVGKDLPRVRQEIEALKNLVHHNIARLIQVMETPNKLFIILEYCGGGELFDYIVSRDSLQEREGRGFFRQILAAVAYIHSKGYCHRDLKPENILLDTENNIKLIDFGLCACPSGGLGETLATCCGSPAYAAPELVSGKNYYGGEADVWSLGVLLYALLCGFLPFEDNNVSKLYKKIQSGVYESPTWLSPAAVDVIRRCLTVDTSQRARIEDLMLDPWVVQGHSTPIVYWSSHSKYEFDETVVGHMAEFFNVSRRDIKLQLADWKYDNFVAIYQVLLKKKSRGQPLDGVLKKLRSVSTRASASFQRSPSCTNAAITAGMNPAFSMESSTLIDDVFEPINPQPILDVTTPKRNQDRSALVDRTPVYNNISTFNSARKHSFSTFGTPSFRDGRNKAASNSMDGTATPKANLVFPAIGAMTSNQSPQRTHSCDILDTPGKVRGFGSLRRPTSRLASIEDNIDRIVDLLTPKKRASLTTGPRHTRCFGNVALVENCAAANVLLHEVHRICREKDYQAKLKLYTVSCKQRDPQGRVLLKFTLEIVLVSKYKEFGILRKRLQGDTWHYKKVTQEILNSIDIK